jgi:membrane protease YdiL (CAAX protease family)
MAERKSISAVAWYLAYTFSISWLSWISIIAANKYLNVLHYGEPLFWIPYTIGSLGPAISAYVVYRKFIIDSEKKSFIHFIFGNAMSLKIWLIFISFLMWRLMTIWISVGIDNFTSVLSIFINLPFLIAWGGLEELGWRGILQPKLESIISYLPSILLVSIIWSSWHIPLWFIEGSVQSGFPFWLYYLSGLILTASFTTLYKYTQNLFLCIINHAWFNGCIGLILFVGSNGITQIKLNGTLIAFFSVEFFVSIILGMIYHRKKVQIL